jgi:PAS domain S-box-containing protein
MNHQITSILQKLTQPAASIEKEEHRHRARMLSTLLIPLIIFVVLGILAAGQSAQPQFFALIILLITYALSRTRYYILAAIISIMALSVPSFYMVIIATDYSPPVVAARLSWIVLNIVFSGLIFSFRGIAITCAANLIGVLLLPVILPELSFSAIMSSVGFILSVSAITLIYSFVREQNLWRIEQQSQQLRASEERYRALFEAAPSGIAVSLRDGQVLMINDAMKRLFGYTKEELSQLDASSYYGDVEDRERLFKLLEKDGFVRDFEVAMRPKNGKLYYASLTIAPFPLLDKEAIITMMTDITERKQAQDTQQRYAARLKNLHEIDRAILGAETPQATAQIGLGHLRQLVPCQRATIILFDLEADKATIFTRNINGDTQMSIGSSISLDFWDVESLQAGNTHSVADIRELSQPRLPALDMLLAEGIVSYINIPLIAYNELLGVLSLAREQPGYFESEEINISREVSNQLAIAIRQTTLFEDNRRRADELDVLRQVTLDITEKLDLNELLEAIIKNAIALLKTENGSIYLYHPEHDDIDGTVYIGESLTATGDSANERGQGLSGIVWGTGKSLVIDDYSQWEGRLSSFNDRQLRAIIGVPIRWRDEFLGVLCVAEVGSSQRIFSQHDADLLELFANQAGIAVHQTRLSENNRRRADELDTLRRVTLDITQKLDLDELLNAIVKNAITLSGANGGGITLYRPKRGVLEWAIGINLDMIPIGFEMKRGQGISGQVWERGEPVIVDNYSEWEHHAPGFGDFQFGAQIGAPIQWQDEFLGTIGVTHIGLPQRTFSQHDADLLQLLANQAAVAIKNARLYEQVQHHAANLEKRVVERTVELADAKQQTETILQNVADAIIFTDINANILYFSPSAEELTGYSLLEVVGKKTSILKSGNTPWQTYKSMWTTILSGQIWRGTLINKRKDGTLYDADLTIAAVKDADGIISHFVAVQRDVTEERKLAVMKERFIADAAHDLGNPVTILQTSLYLLKKDPDHLEKHLSHFDYAANRLSRLVKDLLTVLRLDRGSLAPELQVVNLTELIEKIIEGQQMLVDEKRLSVSFRPAQNLPQAVLDPHQIERAIGNLFANAINYTEDGGNVWVTTEAEDNNIIVIVRDDGIGITPQDLPHIFDRFYRSDQAKITSDGTGLGLPIVREIVELHGGSVAVESEVGKGSTFTVLLPK